MQIRKAGSVLLLGFLFFAGCSRGCGAPSERALQKQNQVITIQLTGEPVSLDPSLAEDGLSLRVLSNLMDGLVGFDSEGKLRNLLAESYRISEDGLHYAFTLRPGAKWSDDRPIQAQDFVFALKRAMKPGSGSLLAELLRPIQEVSVKDGKLVIDLKQATPYFLQVLALPVALPLREDVLIGNDDHWPWDAPSTGPYKFAAYQPGRRLLLEKNDNYWGKKPSISLLNFLIIQDESTGVNLFETGQVDILSRVPTADLERFKKKGWIHQDPFLATYYLTFNARKPPFNDREMRRAVAGVIHRDQIVAALASGETPARSWVPRGLEGYIPYSDPAPVFAGSVAAGKKKLGGQTVQAIFDSGSRNAMIMEKVQNDVKEGLGLQLELTNLDWKSFVKAIHTDPAPIFRMGWLSPIHDPIVHLQVFTSSNPNNTSGWGSPQYDQLVAEIGRMSPGSARDKKILEAQKILVDEEAVVIPLYHYVQNTAVSSRVRGFRINPFGVIRVDELSLSSSK